MATLELYLIRHGIAAERGDQYPDDSKRPLTTQGIARLRKEARALDELGVNFELILTSPLARARQTADTLAETMKSKPTVTPLDALEPAGSPADVIQELGKHVRNKSRVALIGHEPDIGELAARLIAARAPLAFKKGAIARIDFEVLPPKGHGQLAWFLPPKMLRKLGG